MSDSPMYFAGPPWSLASQLRPSAFFCTGFAGKGISECRGVCCMEFAGLK